MMELEDGGYATTDEELDSDADDLHIEHDLKQWLKQLDNKPVTKLQSSNKNFKTNSASMSDSKQATAAELEFDSILGELSNLEQQFDVEQSNVAKEHIPHNGQSIVSRPSEMSNQKEAAQWADFSDLDSQLQGALQELTALVHTTDNSYSHNETETKHSMQEVEKPAGKPPHSSTICENMSTNINVDKNRRPSDMDSLKLSTSLGSETTSGNKITKESSQVCLRIYSPDGSIKCIMADGKTTVKQLCDILLEKNHTQDQLNWVLCEQLPGLYMVRQLEESLLILDQVVRCWSKDSTNRLLFKNNSFDKYANLSWDRHDMELEGLLHVKSKKKKVPTATLR